MTNLQNARSFETLLGSDVESGPYEFPLLFKADGWLDRSRSKTRFKLLRAIDQKLRVILHDGERVYFATSGTTSTIAENYFSGPAVAQAINRRALVFTTERVILLQINSRRAPKRLVSQIAYSSIASVKATWNGYCQLRLVDKSTLNFVGVPRADRKHLASFLAGVLTENTGSAAKGSSLEHLCPHCYVPLAGHPQQCPTCHGGIKSPRTAMLRSLIFPGLGDFYLGHTFVAALETFGAALVWFALVISPFIGGMPNEDGEVLPPDAGYWITAAIIIALAHGIDAMMTRHFALKGHHPA